MHKLIIKSILISLMIVLLGVVAIIQINNEFTANVTIKTSVSTDTVKNMNSLGVVIILFIVAGIMLLILSPPKKKLAGKKKRKVKRSRKSKKKR